MKLNDKQIAKYSKDFHIELSKEALSKEWHLDSKYGFLTINKNGDSIKMVNLKTDDGDWLRIDASDLTNVQYEGLTRHKTLVITPDTISYQQ